MVLRHRKPTNVQETVQNVVQELDAFVKVEEHYVEQSVLGAVGMTLNFLLSVTKEFVSPVKLVPLKRNRDVYRFILVYGYGKLKSYFYFGFFLHEIL